MQIIPISATPSQTLAVVLAGQSCKINIYQKNTGLFVDLYVNDALIIGGVIALDRNRIVRSAYLGFVGDLAFVDTQGSDTPVYDGLGGRYLLLYLDPADIVAPTFDVKFFTPLITPITGFAAVGGFEENTLDWDMVDGFTYDLYWSLSAGITPSTGTKIAGVSASYAHTGLEDGTRYYYVLVATDANGGISVSDTVDAITIPAAPLNLVAVGGSMQETLTWNAAVGAASYNLYWSDVPGVTPETGTAIVGATSGHVLSGLLNAKQYYFVVTAVNESGEGPPSAQANAATSTLAAPTGLAAVGGANEVTISWTNISGLTYNLYWSLTTGVTPLTGTKIAGVTSPHVHSGLGYTTEYFYVLTAENAGGESAASAEVNATTLGHVIGAAWVERSVPQAASYGALAYGGGLFVAVGGGNDRKTMYSNDNGETWNIGGLTPDTSPSTSGDWLDVLYTNGLFIAVGANTSTGEGLIATSPTGAVWTSRAVVASKELGGIAVADNGTTVCAVAKANWGGTNQILRSTDGGLTWVAKATGTNRNWQDIAFGNGKFVAVGTPSGGGHLLALTSADYGATWVQTDTGFTTGWTFEKAITFGNGLFVLVGATGIATSPDGTTWTARTYPGNTRKDAVTFASGVFCAVGFGTQANNTVFSTDGINWTARNSANANPWGGVAGSGNFFVATAFSNVSSVKQAMNITVS
jgi:hypothetical protein